MVQHWEGVKWILGYLKGKKGHGIMFGNQHGDHSIVGFVDSNYAGDSDDERSTKGCVFTLIVGLVCCKSIIRSLVAMSTIEAGYMALADTSKEDVWLVGLVKEVSIENGGA